MKIRLPVADLQVGMFIDSMEGSWWLNPFWKRSFLLSSPKDLDRLAESGIEWVTIDDTRGRGTGERPAGGAATGAIPRPARMPEPPRTMPRATVSRLPVVAAAQPDFEIQRAAAVVERSKRAVMDMFTDVRMGKAILPRTMTSVVDQICDSFGEDPSAILKVTRLKKKNEYTYLHSVAVAALMIALARHLRLGEEMVRTLGVAGLLHDIGKMAVPEDMLEKPGRLTDAEFAIVRTHPREGHAMLIAGSVSPVIHDVVLHHHEKLDGSGYPDGLSGDAVSLHARMGAVCDVYDAVTSKRSYKRQWSPSEALTQMRAWTGHFDPVILDAFMRCIEIYPVGLLVRLRSNRLALVKTENLSRPTQPMVRAFYLPREGQFIDPVDIRLSGGAKGESVVAIEDGALCFPGDWDRVRAAVMAGQRPDRVDDDRPLRSVAAR